jgi:UDP-N-acetylglucosamine transferase subunit ALG13
MIFVTIGTHVQFNRLVKKIDEIAPKINEKIIIQTGSSTYVPKNVEHFAWSESLEKYMKEANLIISHGGLSCLEGLKKHKKPTIIVPRQYEFGEHINDHQVEFAEEIERKYGVKIIKNITDLTPGLLNNYRIKIEIKDNNLKKLQNYLKRVVQNL